MMLTLRLLLTLAITGTTLAQEPAVLSGNLARSEGRDEATRTAYVKLYLNALPSTAFDITQPTLTAQCTQDATGKQRFELLLNFGNVTDTSFNPIWKVNPERPTGRPPTAYTHLTLEFLGYTKVKPMRREFVTLLAPSGQLRYNPPGMHSENLDDASHLLQYLRALPTLRVTGNDQTADFLTTDLLNRLRTEPLCKAAGL